MRTVVRGAGSIGARHAQVLTALGAQVTAWPVRPREGVVLDAGVYAGADLAVIATDTARHIDDAIEALNAGAMRVLVEKPVAPTAPDAARLAEHPRAGVVWVAAPLRAHEGFRHTADAVAGLTGPLSAHIVCGSWLPDWRPDRDYRTSYAARPQEGGVLRDLVHELDYAAALFGAATPVGAVLAGGPLEMATEQAATLLWTTPTATVTARLDYVTRPAARGVVVRSPAGSVSWDVPSATVTVVDADGAQRSTTFAADLDRNRVMTTQAAAALALSPDAPVERRIAAGAPATLDDAIAAVALCDAARELSDRRHP